MNTVPTIVAGAIRHRASWIGWRTSSGSIPLKSTATARGRAFPGMIQSRDSFPSGSGDGSILPELLKEQKRTS